MIVLKNSDLLEVKLKSLIADYDRDTLVTLYQPLVGYAAISLYFTLWTEANNQKITLVGTHEQILSRMGIQSGDFVKARKFLESLGLLKSTMEKSGDSALYRYELYAPKTPREFFNDTLLYGLLIKYLGEKEASKLKNIYVNENEQNNGSDISASFGEMFHPDFEDRSFTKALEEKNENVSGRKKAKVGKEFNLETFFDYLSKICQFESKTYSDKEIKMICKLSLLFGIDEATAADRVSKRTDIHQNKGNRLIEKDLIKDFKDEIIFKGPTKTKRDFNKGIISSDSEMATLIKFYETHSPKEFLSYLQNGTQPAPSDLNIAYDLGLKFDLPTSVINVILFYALNTNNNILSKSFCEKIAASLARENIRTAIDAINYINENNNSYKRGLSSSSKENSKKEQANVEEQISDKEAEEKWNELLSDFEEDK